MNTQKIIYKNRYEINKIFNLLKLKRYSINIDCDKVANIKNIIKDLYSINIDKSYLNSKYIYCYIYLYNNDLLQLSTNINRSILFNNIVYGNTNMYDYINNKYFMQLLQNILNI